MPGEPCSGSNVWEALDRTISESGENRGQIVAHWEFQPAAAFHDRENRRDLGSRLWTADVQPVLSTKSYRMEFSARLVLSSNSGVFQEAGELLPKRKRVVAGFVERARGQRSGLGRSDLSADLIKKRPGSFLTQSMTPSEINLPAASFGIDDELSIRATIGVATGSRGFSCTASKNCLLA
jgi:hypothetical protein